MPTDLATICVLCSQNCGLRADVEDNTIVALRPDPTNPITRGYACNKFASIPKYVRHAQRLEHPLARQPDGSYAKIGWDQALAEIGAKLAAIRDRHPGRAIALIGGGGQGNHLDIAYGLGFLSVLGSPMWFSALAQEKTQHALVDQLMFDAPVSSYLHADTERTRYLLLIGTNPLVSNRGYLAREYLGAIHRDPHRRLVVVDPRRTETAKLADRHLAIRPGADTWLLLGLLAEIVRGGRTDAPAIARGVGFEALRDAVSKVSLDEVAARTELPAEVIRAVADEFAAAESASIMGDLGVEQVPFSTLNSYLMRAILAVTGNLGRPGGAVFHATFGPETPPVSRPARTLVAGVPSIAMIAPYGMFSPTLFPEEVLSDHPDRIRAAIVEGANPLVQYTDSERWRAAFDRLELSVVIEPAFTETARRAHYVLPAPVGYEKWEYSGFPKRYPEIDVQVRPPLVKGPPEARQEAEIFFRLLRASGRIGPASRALHLLAKGARSPAGAAAYLAAVSASAIVHGPAEAFGRALFAVYETLGPHLPAPALAAIWAQCHLFSLGRRRDRGRTRRGRPFADGEALFQAVLEHPEGLEVGRLDPARNYEDHVRKPIDFAPPVLIAELHRALQAPPIEVGEYPFVLNGGLRTRFNANTIQRDPSWRRGNAAKAALHLAPADAARLGVAEGEIVRVVSPRSRLLAPVRIDEAVRPGNLLVPNGFGLSYPSGPGGELVTDGFNANELIDVKERDPLTGCPYLKFIRCRVEKVTSSESRAS